jgi:hypothetical protein
MLSSSVSRTVLKTLLCVLVVAQVVAPAAVLAQVPDNGGSSPTIASDKDDYAPGELVTLTGSGWQPGESVHIWVNDDLGRTWERNSNVTANEGGNIIDSFNLPDWFVATYEVVATGELSGTARTTFTDGNVQVQTSAGGPTVTLQYRQFTSTSCVGSPYDQGSVTISPTSGGTNVFPQNSGSFSLEVPSTADSQVFSHWATQGGVSSTNNPFCFNAIPGNRAFTAHYGASTVTTTSLSVASVSGTYGGTANLSATLTAGSSGVSGKLVSFTLNGSSVGSATTNASGVASLSGVSLIGINAGNYATGVGASFSGDSTNDPSSGSNSLTVAKKQVTGSFTAANKVYDGTTDAQITGRSLAGVVGSDNVSLSGGTASFANKNVGIDKTVTGSGFSLSGADTDNYSLASSSLNTTADITPRDLNVSATGVNKLYDGTADAIVNLSTDKLSGDVVTAAYTSASFNNKNVGTDKPVSVSGISISGADAGNYNLTNTTAATTANITAKEVTGSFTAADKVYDGNNSATITGRSLSGAISGDDVELMGGTATFDNANVGNNKTVTGNGFSLSGAEAGNYSLAATTLTTTASITAWNARGHGFYQPVGVSNSVFVAAPGSPPLPDSSTVWNTVKGGSTIPLKFNLYAGAMEKTSTSDIKGFTQFKLGNCATGTSTDEVEIVTTGSTNLRYDTTDRQFVQNWKTPSVTKEECYRAMVTFADGSSLSAFFKLRK